MHSTTYILGAGAVGLALAAVLTRAGRPAVAVRVSRDDIPAGNVPVTLHGADGDLSVPVRTVSLSRLSSLDGPVVVTTKAQANASLAVALEGKAAVGPIVILQNGLGVEEAFLAGGFPEVYRGILYVTAQTNAPGDVTFRWVNPSPVGVVRGSEAPLARCVAGLTTEAFPFCIEPDIALAAWRKTIINAVFNSICALLDVDNGIFARDAAAAALALVVVRECLALARAREISLTEAELVEQIQRISRGGNGVLISTLQDLRKGRPTEIKFLNLALARLAAAHSPPIDLRSTELLGRLVLEKSRLSRMDR